jgi:Tol biopolymer transport system component/DNA-binding winged helix-turn-helix (wHTH) protein
MAANPKHFYQFGPFRIDVSERTLSRDGRIVAITPKAFDLLLVLVRNRGETVDKETLMKEVWPDSFVEEGNLPVNMTALRRVLGESPDEHTYIETVPRRGYRFVAAVTENWAHDGRPQTWKPWSGMKALVGLRLASAETSVASPPLATRKRMLLALPLAVVGIGAAIALAVYYAGGTASRSRAVRSTIPAPENAQSGFGNVVISPDGLQLALSMESHGKRSLWLGPIGAPSAQSLAGTEGANSPFWSPDSRFIGFFAEAKLKKIEVSTGAVQTLFDFANGRVHGRGGTWSRDGVIVFALDGYGPLYRISESGGDPVAVRPDNWRKEQTYYRNPCFLPDGHHIIYRAGVTAAYFSSERNGIYACSLESNESKRILGADTYAVYSSGHLLFWAHGALMAQPFDEKNLELTGDAVQIAAGAYFDPRNFEAEFSVTENGVLVFVSGAPTLGQLVWFDRDGKQVGKLGEPGIVSTPRISPDGKQIATEIVDPQIGTSDIWVYDLRRNVPTRLTFDASMDTTPVWSPDGSRIAFSSNHKDIRRFGIYQKDLGGSGNEEVLFESDKNGTPQSWSPDGQFIAYARNPPAPSFTQIWVLPLTGERKPFRFLDAELFSHRWPQFSPDGRFIAYVSYESGRDQVCVTSFSGPGFKQQVSTDGGWLPRWRGDGKELFFLAGGASSRYPAVLASKMMAADVKSSGSSLEIGSARPLFDAHPWFGANPPSMLRNGFWQGTVYDVTPDGKRFLMVTAAEAIPATINLVVNWTADLKR